VFISIADDLRTLIGEINSHLAVLKKISDFYNEQSVENAIILSDIFVNFYTPYFRA
jgi:nucleoside diphosphate kinase